MKKTLVKGFVVSCLVVFMASCGGGGHSSSGGASNADGSASMKIHGLLVKDGKCSISVTVTAHSAFMAVTFVSKAYDGSGREIASASYPMVFRSKSSKTFTTPYFFLSQSYKRIVLKNCNSIKTIENKLNTGLV